MIEPGLVAKAVILNEAGKVLVLTRSETDKTRAGEYDFPGGGVEAGETIHQAMARELKEETGLDLREDQLSLGYCSTNYYDQKSRIRFLFVGRISSNTKITLSHEHSASQWLSVDKVYESYNHPVWVGGLRYLIDNKQLSV